MRKQDRYYNQFKRRVKKKYHTFTWNKGIELQMNAKLAFPQRKEKVNGNSLEKRRFAYLLLTINKEGQNSSI